MLSKARIKYIQGLARKKSRDETGLFIAEGPKVVAELIGALNMPAVELLATSQWISQNAKLLSGKESRRVSIEEIDDAELKKISALSTPNQVVGIFEKPVFAKTPVYDNKLTLLLDGIQDPGNLGTIIRCADWFGITNIICSRECVDAFNPKVIQSTMGSICRVRTQYCDLAQFIDAHANIPLFAATLDGENLYNLETVTEGFILIGNESKGISKDLQAKARYPIAIPKKGQAESLNAAMAAGIILAHLTR